MIDNTGPDEDTFVLPSAWRRARHPRRDRPDVPAAPAVDDSAPTRVRALQDEVRDEIDTVLALPATAPEIADAGRAHLRGEPDPLGAAAAALIVRPRRRRPIRGRERLFVDAWTAEHGVAFAARAYADMNGHRAEYERIDGVRRCTGVRARGSDETRTTSYGDTGGVRRLRAHLAAAPDDVYAEAVAGLAERRGHYAQRLVAAYLAPTRDDWVDDMCADRSGLDMDERWLPLCALGRPHQPAALGLPLSGHTRELEVVATLVEGAGPQAALPLLTAALDGTPDRKDQIVRRLLEILAVLPLDDAFQALLDRLDRGDAETVLRSAVRRFPARAMRLLPGSDAPRARELLAGLARVRPDLAEAAFPAGGTRAPDAPPEALPPLLTAPPWNRKGPVPAVIEGLPLPGTGAITWAPGEGEKWPPWRASDIQEKRKAGENGYMPAHQQIVFLVDGPPGICEGSLTLVGPEPEWGSDPRLVEMLLPVLNDATARTMAGWLVRCEGSRTVVRAWFDRHGLAAVPPLLPDALGALGPARDAAEAALRLLADRHGPEPIVEAARVHGDAAAAAIEAVVAADPLEALPAKAPAVPAWADARVLPRILLRDGTHALPPEAAAHVLTMLAMSASDDAYAGIRIVRDICDPRSLAEFGRALFRLWEEHGAAGTENWAFTQLALTGDDETVRRLTPLIRTWSGEGGRAEAAIGLDVLAAIGTETALKHLNSLTDLIQGTPR